VSGETSAAAPGAVTRRSSSPGGTEALGAALAAALEPGDVVALTGPLGAGKTRFVAGLAAALAAAARVRSPSFTLVNEYRGRVTLIHLDLYRLEGAAAETLGLEEYLERGAIVAEWGEKLPARFLGEALAIEFESTGRDERVLRARAARGRGLALLEAWRAATRGAEAER
jgi:tRNA threonylcarbamoyladenosine biosynthesis protein TsaE